MYTYFINIISDVGTLVTGEIDGEQTLVILAEYLKKNPFAGRKQVTDFLCKQHNFQIKEQDISFAEAFSGKSYFDLICEGGFCDENGIMDTNIPDVRFYAEDILQGNIGQIVFDINL